MPISAEPPLKLTGPLRDRVKIKCVVTLTDIVRKAPPLLSVKDPIQRTFLENPLFDTLGVLVCVPMMFWDELG